MKKIFIAIVIFGALLLSYKLFEPIFAYNIGRKPMVLKNYEPQLRYNEPLQIKADSILMASYKKLKTPAISAAVSINGQEKWANAIGFSDIDNEQKVTTTTLFRTGSTSKAITSVGLGVLLASGKLNLDTRFGEQVQYANDINQDLTVRQLVSHTSGIRNYGSCFCFPIWENLNTKNYENLEDAISVFESSDLLFSPGSDFSYSTYNFTLLSAMMEGASNTSFENFMNDAVFRHLGMKHTIAEKITNGGYDISEFYDVESSSYNIAYPVNNSNKIAGGGFLSTPSDLVSLGNAMFDHSLFSREIKERLITPVKLDHGDINEENYALGWRNDTTEKMFDGSRKIQIIHHGGIAKGGTSFLVLFPKYNISISILINRSSMETTQAKNDKTHSQNAEAAL